MDRAKPIIRLDDRSRMSREAHVRICEGVEVKLPHSTRRHIKISLNGTVNCSNYVKLLTVYADNTMLDYILKLIMFISSFRRKILTE